MDNVWQLLDEHGIETVAALDTAVAAGRVSVSAAVRVGLRHHADLQVTLLPLRCAGLSRP